ncbi:DUF4232 domain-containing protein [Streptomyces sp. V3I7]|uniref:DUF4232 domain-containing protein n=1 Tax=Streptomyces sp. V3I7 TaxID=3042278 RepID=UPI0027813D50|nr:DUF4232 domain-containing protein [Streptomyces sp. V3I7]MDQ0994509.1 hypothetical protein [Streptomyces sp. V3I7]
MTYTSPSSHRAALLVGSLAVLGLVAGCGTQSGAQSAPQKITGKPAPATGGATAPRTTDDSPPASPAASPPGQAAKSSAPVSTGHVSGDRTAPTGGGARCHTSELRASVGRNDPGAGQENFPVVLTNASGRTCTVYGYPGAAFVNASGGQLGPDPKRAPGSAKRVTLKPGQSAWAGLSFSNPEVSGAKKATPAALLVTPPDERDSLRVAWKAGAVPVSGNASTVSLTVLSPGTAP